LPYCMFAYPIWVTKAEYVESRRCPMCGEPVIVVCQKLETHTGADLRMTNLRM